MLHARLRVNPAPETAHRADELSVRPGSFFARLPLLAVGLAVVGVALLGWMSRQSQRFYFSYLTAFLFFLSLALGALFFVLVQHAARAGWSVVVRRAAEVTAATLPLFALFFVPLASGIGNLFHWAHPELVRRSHVLQHRRPYQNPSFFFARAALYLIVWGGLAITFYRQSVRQDRSRAQAVTRRLQRLSAPGLVLFGVTVTFAGFDWVMGLDPHWYSTLFGVYFFAGSVVSFFALLALLSLGLRRGGPARGVITVEHLHDLGKLVFAFTCFWGYIAFSQFMLIWYANIPEETAYYLRRLSGSWRTLSIGLAVGHFALPFLFLLPRTVKRSAPALALGALWMLVMHYLDLYWLVMPNLSPAGLQPHGLDLGCVLAVGGFFVAAVSYLLGRAPVIPVGDPRLPESLSFENH
jgi:hypothetical protein